ncbi:TBC1 domain family member 15 [Coccinella septempunctata]|uniref:TBC1 domain family member 15 n=1 Tax=Coccinella septempunctata TaxID=41139 RepID=UPI001D05F4FB|nr:TBC1 domain family member 15 [Coccinella septempunctata]
MSDNSETEDVHELFVQDGVLLFSAAASFISFVKSVGTLMITEYSDGNKYIEWKPIDVTVDSDIQDQEWAVVNTVERRIRTLSGSVPPEYKNRSKYLRVNFEEIKSFRVSDKNRRLTFNDGKSEQICTYLFQHGNCEHFVNFLKSLVQTIPSRRDKHLLVVLDKTNPEFEKMDRSFAELNVYTDSPCVWKLWDDFQERPMVATFEAFAKITDLVYRSPEQRELSDDVKEILNKSITECGSTSTSHSQGDYEVIDVPHLPKRRDFPRGKPLTLDQWLGVQDHEERIEDSECLKLIIFQGGITPSLRKEVWKYLLDYYPWNCSKAERQKLISQKNDDYFSMKLQWKTMTKTQEDNFTDYRERKSQIEKDVSRTDRTIDFYAGDNNPNLQILNDILMTYVMYNFDLGYVQGMSDLLAPILHLMQSEVDAFWCFVGFMNKLSSNFDADQNGMKEQLSNLFTLIAFIDPDLASYFNNHDSGNMFFCFRWLLVWFKRELSEEDCMSLWEVLWTGFPCENFHLLLCCAILTQEKQTLMENNYGFTDILKHINDLCGRLNVEKILNDAQAIYYQIKESKQLNDIVRLLLGLPISGNSLSDNHETSPFEENMSTCNGSTSMQRQGSQDSVRISPDENSFEKCISSNFL